MVAVAVLLAGCGWAGGGRQGPPATPQGGPAPGSTGGPTDAPGADELWPTYHHDPAHSGQVPGTVGHLGPARETPLDGAVYASPLVVPARSGAMVVVATENDTLYGVRGGSLVWTRHVGAPAPRADLPCGNIDPLGITGTPVYDDASGLVYAVAELGGPVRHELVAVDPGTGALAWHLGIDPPGATPRAEQQRGALAVAAGRVWVPQGGLEGDCGPYVGKVVSLPTGRSAPAADALLTYRVPTSRQGGMWQAGGVVVGPDGSLYEAVGNGASRTTYDGSDSVIRLSPETGRRLSWFAPQTWQEDNAKDLDLGSAMPLLLPGGGLVQAGKRGTVHLLHQGDLGGMGGDVASTTGCHEFGGGAVSGAGADALAVLPCTEGLTAYRTSGGHLERVWRVDRVGVVGSPVVVGSTVLAPAPRAGDLVALDAGSGRVTGRVHVGALSRFATPAVSAGVAYLGTMSGLVSVGLR